MKASMFLVGASAILASASPIGNALQERAMKTEWVYEMVTVVVTDHQQATKVVEPKKAEATAVVFKEVTVQEKAIEKEPTPAPVVTKVTNHVTVVTVTAEAKQEEKKVYKQPEVYTQPEPVVEKPKTVVVEKVVEKPKPKPAVSETPKPVVVVVEQTKSKPVEEPKTTVKKVVKPAATKAAEPEVKVEPSTPDLSLEGSYNDVMLNYHNIHRANHSAPALEWDDELAGYALNTANGCVFEHDMHQGDGGYGQNLASWGATSDIDDLKHKAAAGGITNQWYDNEMANWAYYGQENPPSDMNIDLYGHFTQVVWKDSTKVGCATVKCAAGTVLSFPSWYTVCNYNPQGNFGGRYGDNVLKPEGAKRVSV
ncbi:hypothetical protein ACHAPU_003927 [Fusarium lateritium]